MRILGRMLTIAALAGLAGGTAACGDSVTGPGAAGDGSVSLSFAVRTAATGSASIASPNFDIVLNDGQNTLEITRVAMVVREIELERQFDECDDSSSDNSGSDSSGSDSSGDDSGSDSSGDDSSDDDSCEELSFGPELVELPVDGGTDRVITLQNVEAGVYDEIEFDIHKPDDDTQADRAFIAQHPEFRRVSIRVEGLFNGTPFLYLTDLNEDQEIHLADPIVVGPGSGPVNVTLSLDVSSWFERADGSLIDPATANDGGPNEDLVEDNIENSIEGFEDDDFDGEDDGDDDGDDDGADGGSDDDDGTPDQGPGDN